MDPTQLVDEALRRFTLLRIAANAGDDAVGEEASSHALTAAFQHLAKLDGWAKIALDRMLIEPENISAAIDLKISMEQAVRLHPQYMRTLYEACAGPGIDAPTTVPPAPAAGRAHI